MKKLLIITILFLFSCNQNLKHQKVYYSDGSIEASFYVDKNGKMQGDAITFYKNGKISSSNFFINGKGNGIYKMFYPNGKIKSLMHLKNDLFDGLAYYFDSLGNIESEILYKNEKKLKGKYFYKNGTIEHIQSLVYFKNKNELPNCEVFFNHKGKILFDTKNNKNSRFVKIDFVNNNILKVKLFGLFNDSIVVKYKQNFNDENNIIRTILTNNQKLNEIILDIKPTDYYNGSLNILIETYQFRSLPNIKLEPGFSEMYIQLDKGEKPAKFNIDPIL